MEKRDFYPNQLWNATGPVAKDVRQSEFTPSAPDTLCNADPATEEVLDCWWKAGEAAIAHVSPEWIQHLFVEPQTDRPYTESGNPEPQADAPKVQVWNPNDLSQALYFTASISNRSQTEDKGMSGYFWPDALSQALSQLGRETDIPGVDKTTGQAGSRNYGFEQPLSILTGYPASSKLVSDYGSDTELWSHFQYCNVTPIMFNTNETMEIDNDVQFGDHHVYPIIGTWWETSGQRWVSTRNVWGRNDIFKFEDVQRVAVRTLFLTNWNRLELDGSTRRSLPGVEGPDEEDPSRRHPGPRSGETSTELE